MQVEDYARRKEISVTEAEKWLAPNLAYDTDDAWPQSQHLIKTVINLWLWTLSLDELNWSNSGKLFILFIFFFHQEFDSGVFCLFVFRAWNIILGF